MKIWKPLYKIEEAEKIILGVPFAEKVTGKKGAEKAPDALRKAFLNSWGYDFDKKKDLFDEPIVDLGNIPKTSSFKTLEKNLTKKIKQIRKKNEAAKIIFIGGDHSITQITTKALSIKSYLSLDAHFDLIDKYEGDKNSHACTSRRVHEQGAKIIIRGVRNASKEEYEFAVENDINWSKSFTYSGKIDYFSLDIDVLDPVFTSTGTPEAFGATPQQVIETIRNTNFNHFDLVEWIPLQGEAYAISFLKEVLWKK